MQGEILLLGQSCMAGRVVSVPVPVTDVPEGCAGSLRMMLISHPSTQGLQCWHRAALHLALSLGTAGDVGGRAEIMPG